MSKSENTTHATDVTTGEHETAFSGRFGWATAMFRRHGREVLERTFPAADVVHVEAEDCAVADVLDRGGVDALVSHPDGTLDRVAVRIRTAKRGRFEREFSLRCANDHGRDDWTPEREKLERAATGDGSPPVDYYLFGVSQSPERQMSLDAGLRRAYLLDAGRVADALARGTLSECLETHSRGDGSTATYIPLAALERIGAPVARLERDVEPDHDGDGAGFAFSSTSTWTRSARPITVRVTGPATDGLAGGEV